MLFPFCNHIVFLYCLQTRSFVAIGISLGMELMPLEDKLCAFDCRYCECGFNRPVSPPLYQRLLRCRRCLMMDFGDHSLHFQQTFAYLAEFPYLCRLFDKESRSHRKARLPVLIHIADLTMPEQKVQITT